ncbi:MAG: 50S ribosomal protein L13 [Bacteroidota bacterium]|nr:50S ribosomal protein L13 [Bacteroidota bacterium]
MDTLSYKTISANKQTADKKWLLVNADNMILGRLASQVAFMLRGKHKTNFTPHTDCGDNVVVINADKIRLTGQKWTDREHFKHTGYPGGQKRISPKELFDRDQTILVKQAVKGMLPKNKLGRAIFTNLHVYAGPNHNQEAQQPKEITLKK